MTPDQPVGYTEYERVEPYVENVSLKEVKNAIFNPNNRKAPK